MDHDSQVCARPLGAPRYPGPWPAWAGTPELESMRGVLACQVSHAPRSPQAGDRIPAPKDPQLSLHRELSPPDPEPNHRKDHECVLKARCAELFLRFTALFYVKLF